MAGALFTGRPDQFPRFRLDAHVATRPKTCSSGTR